MAGPFDFLHIKRRTAGSSNELSFDVLDAARHDLDEKRKSNRAARPLAGPKPSQGNYEGVAGTSTLSAVPEVERRKRARRARAIRVRAAIAVVVVAVVAVGAFAGYRFYQDTVDYTGRFTALIDRFVQIDQSIVGVDALMADPMSSVESSARDQALDGFPDIEERLADVRRAAHEMSDSAMSGDDTAALDQVDDAAAARLDMLAAATDVFKLSDIANRQVDEALGAWNQVLAADAVAREASEAANAAATEEAISQARGKTDEAASQMTAARSQLVVIGQGISGLDFSPELQYIDKRLESLAAASATSDALLAGDRAGAIAANDVYNAADREAAALAASLPDSIGDLVKEQYADEAAAKKGIYAAARAAAATADSALRAYIPA